MKIPLIQFGEDGVIRRMKEGDEAAKRKQKKQKPKMWQQRTVEDVKNE